MKLGRRSRVMGIPVDPLTLDQSVNKCLQLIQEGGNQHVVINASKVVMAHRDEELRQIIDSCPIVNADGQSVVWAARSLGIKIPERVAGIDLMFALVDQAARLQLRIFLLGAKQEVVESVQANFEQRGALVVGARNGYWTQEDEPAVVEQISATKPDILFVAMPSPRKEKFLARWLPNLNTGLAFGVGGSFDVVAGVTKRAPVIMQKIGMEWLFRLLQEPKRMFKRYLVGNTKFVLIFLRYRFVLGRRFKNV